MMSTVEQVLRQKDDNTVWSIEAHDLVFNAVRLMSEKNIGALLVREAGRIVGMVTERDYSRKVVLANRSSSQTKVREIMEPHVMYVLPQDQVDGCMALMTAKRVRHLPVIEHGQVVGLISMGDIVKAVISDKQYMIEQLTHYIVGAYTDGMEIPLQANQTEERMIANL